ncbi:hypothetical protein [Streptomyces venezuelae]|uniref:hypothetical protein n=1 Tax=Streptomyces venezuelae TaxID=54571 RepID=UPI001CC26692|nr:hypothetical protein [Streptomyces venezuelae]
MKSAVKAAVIASTMLLTVGAAGSAFASDVPTSGDEVNVPSGSTAGFVPGADTTVKRNVAVGEIPAESASGLIGGSDAKRAAAKKVKKVKYQGELCGLRKIQKTSGRGKTTLVMTVSKSVSSEVSTEVGIDYKIVSAAVGFKVTKSYTVEDQTRFEVPKNKFGYIEAYPLYDKYTFSIYQGSKKKGEGTALRPVGVCFNQWAS